MKKKLKLKEYKFTTFNAFGHEVEQYRVEEYHVKRARAYAQKIVANSRSNEARHGRVTLSK